MRVFPVLTVAAFAFTACDGLSFVAVDPASPEAAVRVLGSHEDVLDATARVDHVGFEDPVEVRVNGAIAPVEDRGDGRWVHELRVPIDSLQPEVVIAIDAGGAHGTTSITVPLLARSGPARWGTGGSLHVPVIFNGFLPATIRPLWRVTFLDARGFTLLSVVVHEPLPQPLVIDGAWVPAEAASAELAVQGLAEIDGAPYPLRLLVESRARVPIPHS